MSAKLNEVLQVDLGTNERTCMDNVVQWEQRVREFETMSRETLPDIVKRAISSRRGHHQQSERTQTLTRNAIVRAAIEAFLAVGQKWGPDRSGPAPMDVHAMTRKGKGKSGKDKEKGNSKGKDTEMEKGVRFKGYCGHCGKWVHRQQDCWSRHGKPVNSVETDTAEPQDVDPPSEQTPAPAAALTRLSPPGLPDDQWNECWIMTLSSQSSYPAQQEFDWTEILADSGAAEHVQRTSLSWSAGSTGQSSCLADSRRNESGDRLRETSASEN